MTIDVNAMSDEDKELKQAGDVIAKVMERILGAGEGVHPSLILALDSLCDYFAFKYQEERPKSSH